MKSRRQIGGAHDIAVHERDVLLAVAVVPEGDHAKVTKAGREIGDRLDPHADMVNAEARAVVVLVPLDEIFQGRDFGRGIAWSHGHACYKTTKSPDARHDSRAAAAAPTELDAWRRGSRSGAKDLEPVDGIEPSTYGLRNR